MAAANTELDGLSDEQTRAAIAAVMEIVGRVDQVVVDIGHSDAAAQNASRLTIASHVLAIFIGRACLASKLPPMQALIVHLETAVNHLARAAQIEISDNADRGTLQ